MPRITKLDRLGFLFVGFLVSVAGYLIKQDYDEDKEFKAEVRAELKVIRIEVTETSVRVDEFMRHRRYRPAVYDQAHYIYPIP